MPHDPAMSTSARTPRPLIFRDSRGHEEIWEPDAATPADEAFLAFLDGREQPGNWVFEIKDEAAGDGIMLSPSQSWFARGKQPAQPGVEVDPDAAVEYALLTGRPQLKMLVGAYADAGLDGLNYSAVWMSDVDELMRAVSAFAGAQAKARERKLVIRDGAGHKKAFTFTFEVGNRSNIKFIDAMQTFLAKHISQENTTFSIECAAAQETLTIETATNVLTRTRGGDEPETTHTRVEDYEAGRELWHRFASSGYAGLSERAAWSGNLQSVQSEGPVENVHLRRVQEREAAEQRRKEIRAMPKLDRKALRTFCAAWSDHGYNDYSTGDAAVYVLYDGWSLEEAAATRETVLAAIETMGLQMVASPPDAAPAEIRIAADPRIDLELAKWS